MSFPTTDLGVDLSVQSGGLGLINLPATSNSDLSSAASQQYVLNQISTVTADALATVATITTLPAYAYNNGSSGVGATITFNATGAVSFDGHALALNDIALVNHETTGSFTMSALSGNTFTASSSTGIYVGSIIGNNSTTSVVTVVSGTTITVVDGSGFANGASTYDNRPLNGLFLVTTAPATGVQGILTRESYFDSDAEMTAAYAITVQQGSQNKSAEFRLFKSGAITVGTTPIDIRQIDTYRSANAGVAIDNFGNITAQVSASGAVSIGINGFQNNVSNGVKITSNNLVADLDAAGAIGLNGTSLKVNTGNGITISSNNVIANLAAAGPLYFNTGAVDLHTDSSLAVTSNNLGTVFASTSETNAKSSTSKSVNPAGLAVYQRTFDAGSFTLLQLQAGITVTQATHGLSSMAAGCWVLDAVLVTDATGVISPNGTGYTLTVNQSTGDVTIIAGAGFAGHWCIRGL